MENRQKRKLFITFMITVIVLVASIAGLNILTSSFTNAIQANENLNLIAPTVEPELEEGSEVKVEW